MLGGTRTRLAAASVVRWPLTTSNCAGTPERWPRDRHRMGSDQQSKGWTTDREATHPTNTTD
eukprot:scaffold66929_cov29-Phaeocystis_antarctica.AAC.2